MKVSEIRPDELMSGQRAAMQHDIDMLMAARDRFVAVGCPACGNGAGRRLYEKYGMTHKQCQGCGTQYVSPRPDPALLATFYATSRNYAYWATHVFPASEEMRREKIFKPRARIVEEIATSADIRGGALVEVGAGYGLFCDEVRKLGRFDRIIGIEPTPDLAEVCRTMGFEIFASSFQDVALDGIADVVAAFEVIEHLFSPEEFLRWALKALRPGGHILLTCPNIAGFETLVLGAQSETVDHEHLNLFSPASLTQLAERVGLVDVEVVTPGRLDFEIVRAAYREGALSAEETGSFLATLFETEDGEVGERFQDFLVAAGLSSNMRIIARKPESMPDTGRSSTRPAAAAKVRRIVVFLGNKLVSCDAIVPVMMELCRRTDAGPVRFISLDAASYDAIRENVVLRDGIAAIGTLELLGRRRKTVWTWFTHRLRIGATSLALLVLTLRGRVVFLHFKALNHWPLRALHVVNRSATILCESTAAGYNAVEQRIARLNPNRSAANSRLAAGAMLYFHETWEPLAFARRHERPMARLPDPYRLTAWRDYVDAREVGDFESAGLPRDRLAIVYLLGWFGTLEFLEGNNAARELFDETLSILVEEGNGCPIVIKPHVISDMDVVESCIAELAEVGRNRVVMTKLHPSVLARRSAFFVANYYSTAMLPAASAGIPTIEFSRYNTETLTITKGQSMRPDIVSDFINGDAAALRRRVRKFMKAGPRPADPQPEPLSDAALRLFVGEKAQRLVDAA